MSRPRAALGSALALAAVALPALAAPWLGLPDPNAQPRGAGLAELPPLSRVAAVRLVTGETRYAEDVRPLPGGGVRVLAAGRWVTIPAESIAPDGVQTERRWLGTDRFGRDVLSRLVWGARASLHVGLLSALLAAGLGGLVGLVAGAAGGWTDALLMRFTDLVLSVPRLFLLLLMVALYAPSWTTTVLALGLTSWMVPARLIRSQVLTLRERAFVQSARAAGLPPVSLVLRHLLPAAVWPLMVETVLRVGQTMLLESSLSFLGLGVPPPHPSWGGMVAEGRDRLLEAWWVSAFPGLAIAWTVIALSTLGETFQGPSRPADGAR